MIWFVIPQEQDNCFREYLSFWGAGIGDRIRIQHYERFLACEDPPRGTYILAAIDQLTGSSAELLRRRHAELSGRAGYRFLNHPVQTLRRFDLLVELHKRGLNRHRVLRIGDDLSRLCYPAFVRSETRHTGARTGLIRSERALLAAVTDLVLAGYAPDDLMVVEFSPTAHEDGLFRKYSAFIVGDRIIPRSLARGTDWMLKHASGEATEAMAREELNFVTENPHREQLEEIFALAGVGYGRIDYALLDGRVQTWEINLKPTIGRGSRPSSGRSDPVMEPLRHRTKEIFYRGFEAALLAMDSGEAGPLGAEPDDSAPRLPKIWTPEWHPPEGSRRADLAERIRLRRAGLLVRIPPVGALVELAMAGVARALWQIQRFRTPPAGPSGGVPVG